MPLSRWFLLGVLVVGLACGDGNAPVLPTGMVAAGGAGQSGLPGVTLASPLRVTVTGAGGAAFRGAPVAWTVTTGTAGLGSPVDTTDATGEASTTVTMGTTAGNLVVTATVTGVPAVTFALTVLDPCNVRVTLPPDTTTNGVLTNFDCQFNGPFFTDFYGVTLPAQAGLVVSMNATFDTYLEQYHLNGPFIAVNDDVDTAQAGSKNSRLEVIAAPGTYVFAASTFVGSTTGPYALTVAPRTQAIAGCQPESLLPWVTRGVNVAEQVQSTDCTTIRTGGGRAFSDRVLITLTPTRTLSATLASANFNPRLELYVQTQTGPSFVAAADGSGGTATLTHTPAQAALFRLEITSVDTVAAGAYTLNVTGPAPSAVDAVTLPVVPTAWHAAAARPALTRGKARAN